MKLLFFTQLLLYCFSGNCFSQSVTKDSTFSNSCNLKYCYCDTISIKNEILKYFIVSKRDWYTDQTNHKFYTGEIILYTEKGKFKKKELDKLFLELGERTNLATFIVFNTCKAYEFSVSAIGEPPNYKGYIDDHYLGSFNKMQKGK